MQGPILRKYGVQTVINFPLYDPDGVDLKIDAEHASGDTKIMRSEGAETNTTNAFVDEGQGYSIVLSATEMQASRIVVYVVDQSATKVWLDTALVVETYGNASAQHAFDLGTAVQNVNVTLIKSILPATAIAAAVIDALDTTISVDPEDGSVSERIQTLDETLEDLTEDDGSGTQRFTRDALIRTPCGRGLTN